MITSSGASAGTGRPRTTTRCPATAGGGPTCSRPRPAQRATTGLRRDRWTGSCSDGYGLTLTIILTRPAGHLKSTQSPATALISVPCVSSTGSHLVHILMQAILTLCAMLRLHQRQSSYLKCCYSGRTSFLTGGRLWPAAGADGKPERHAAFWQHQRRRRPQRWGVGGKQPARGQHPEAARRPGLSAQARSRCVRCLELYDVHLRTHMTRRTADALTCSGTFQRKLAKSCVTACWA